MRIARRAATHPGLSFLCRKEAGCEPQQFSLFHTQAGLIRQIRIPPQGFCGRRAAPAVSGALRAGFNSSCPPPSTPSPLRSYSTSWCGGKTRRWGRAVSVTEGKGEVRAGRLSSFCRRNGRLRLAGRVENQAEGWAEGGEGREGKKKGIVPLDTRHHLLHQSRKKNPLSEAAPKREIDRMIHIATDHLFQSKRSPRLLRRDLRKA